MQIKKGASLAGLSPKMLVVLKHADIIWNAHGHELVVTAGTDGLHGPGSYHYAGLALDLRTSYFTNDEAQQVHAQLTKALSKYYDIILHSTHIHVEYDLIKYQNFLYEALKDFLDSHNARTQTERRTLERLLLIFIQGLH
jgi:hypothetical protein